MNRKVLAVAAIVGFAAQAQAGGEFAPVRVLSLSISDETNYVLVFAPEHTPYPNPTFGHCERLEVRGTFSRLKGALPWTHTGLTRHDHIDALAYLSAAQRNGRVVNFGWVGIGFDYVDAKDPCVVKSRALQIIVDRGHTMVMSFHDVV